MNVRRIASLLIVFCAFYGKSQVTGALSLEECYTLARQNYPLIKQRELIARSKDYSVQNATKAYFPQLAINGQATYQSAVTEIPIRIPGITVPELSKDQYKLYAELNQPLYDGGITRLQKSSHEANAVVEEQKLEAELYKLKERINQLFFGILLIDEQVKLLELTRKDVENGLRKTEGAIANGAAFKMNADVLKAELLRLSQRITELVSNREAYAAMLGLYLDKELNASVTLVRPQDPAVSQTINRPELRVYETQSQNLFIQEKMIKAKNRPRFNFFVQAGYGRPALNMLSNAFDPYYIGGIRMSWSLNGLYTLKNDKALLDVTRQNISVQKELFLFNTGFMLKQQTAEVTKLQQLMASDDEIIALRTSVKQAAGTQLENGVISSTDYLREVNAEEQARQNKLLHEVQLLMAKYAQQVTTGG